MNKNTFVTKFKNIFSFLKTEKSSMQSNKKQNNRFLFVMLIIPILHWFVFWLYVNINSILLAFRLPNGTFTFSNFTELYRDIVNPNSTILIALKNTFSYFGLSVFILFPLSLLLAYFFYKKIWGFKTFRVILYFPTLIGSVVLAAVFSNFIMPSGPLGLFLKAIGIEKVPQFLADSKYATNTMLYYTFWTGWSFNMLILGGAFARIPLEIIESAKLDGITPFKELINMILPLLWPTLSTLLILQMTGLFTSSGPVLLFTKGGFDTTTLSYWIFEKIYFTGESAYNSVAATGLVFTLIGVPVILGFKKLVEKVPAVEY